MPRQLTVNGTIFNYPDPGDRSWGEDASDWASEVTDVLSSIVGAGFVTQTTVTINDNVSTFQDVLGAAFSSSITRSFRLTYAVQRTNGATLSVESGVIEGVYTGTEWDYNINRLGDAGMDFQVTASGQLQYKSSSIGGTYSGDMTFYANVITE